MYSFQRGIMFCCFVLFLLLLLITGQAIAKDTAESLLGIADSGIEQQDKPPQSLPGEKTSIAVNADQLTHEFNMTQEKYKLYECILLAAFALISLIIVLKSLCNKPNCDAAHMVNASGLVFIIFGTLFLVLLADVDEQLNAGVGILGAVAGYLFGTMRRMETNQKTDSNEKNCQ